MNTIVLTKLFIFYGLFLMICGLSAITFIGMKAKTALISGGTSAVIALTIAYSSYQDFSYAIYLGIGFTVFLFVIFSWRATKTLLLLLDLMVEKNEEVKGKAIAFLIISLMAVVTLFVFTLQVVF